MRLSDIKGELVFDVIADIIDPIANIATDEAASALFRREKLQEGESARSSILSRVRKAVPALLKGHKNDVIAILATIGGTTANEYKSTLTLAKLIQDATELLTDEAFGELFTSAQSGSSSGSAKENTEEAGR